MLDRSLVSIRRMSVVLLSAFAAASCSSPSVLPAVNVAAQVEAPAPPEQKLDPVPEPDSLVAVVRIGTPDRDLASWQPLFAPTGQIGRMLSHGADPLMRALFGALGEEIETTLPIDLAVLEHPYQGSETVVERVYVGAFVLRDLAAARRKAVADFDVRDAEDGGLTLTPRRTAEGQATTVAAKLGLVCRVYAGGVPVSNHLVCALDFDEIVTAGPYLARTVSRRPQVPGVHLDISEGTVSRALAMRRARATRLAAEPMEPGEIAGMALAMRWGTRAFEDFTGFSFDLASIGGSVTLTLDKDFQMKGYLTRPANKNP